MASKPRHLISIAWLPWPNPSWIRKNLRAQLAPHHNSLTDYQDENGKSIYDLPGLPIVAEDTAAPVRFLPEYHNILIAHQNRSRILPAQYRKQVFLSAGRVIGTVLIDGFVRATWKVETE